MICDDWPGIEDCFEPGVEILIACNGQDVVEALAMYDESERKLIGSAFRARALRDHTYEQRAVQVENAILESIARRKDVTTEIAVRR
jgi:spore maturation protein CgeB